MKSGWESLRPIVLQYFANEIRAVSETREAVTTIGVGDRRHFSGVEGFVPVRVDVDRPTGKPCLTGFARAVAVEIFELDAGDAAWRRLSVAEVNAVPNLAGRQRKPMPRCRERLRPAGLRDFADDVRSGV